MARAFLFPGQGSQAVGMGRSLAEAFPAAREVFEEVDDALSHKLTRLMFEGPESDLTLTENAQPALMAVSIAALRVLEAEGGWRLCGQEETSAYRIFLAGCLASSRQLLMKSCARGLMVRFFNKTIPTGT